MKQIFDRRYTPENVRAFKIDENNYALVADRSFFETKAYLLLRRELWDKHRISEEHVYGVPIETQIELLSDKIQEEVIL